MKAVYSPVGNRRMRRTRYSVERAVTKAEIITILFLRYLKLAGDYL